MINIKNKRAIIFFLTLLQNSTTLHQFNIILENIFNIFNLRKQNQKYFDSKIYIERVTKNRFEDFEITFATTQSDRERSKNLSKFNNDETKKDKKKAKLSYMESSPWTPYFEKMIQNFKKVNIVNPELEKSLKTNIYYRPDLFKLIQKQLYLTPVWSGIFIALHFDANKGNKKFNI